MHHVTVQDASYTSQTNAVPQALIQKGRWWSDKTDQSDTDHTNPGWATPAALHPPWVGRGTKNEDIPINPKGTSASVFSTAIPTDLPKPSYGAFMASEHSKAWTHHLFYSLTKILSANLNTVLTGHFFVSP